MNVALRGCCNDLRALGRKAKDAGSSWMSRSDWNLITLATLWGLLIKSAGMTEQSLKADGILEQRLWCQIAIKDVLGLKHCHVTDAYTLSGTCCISGLIRLMTDRQKHSTHVQADKWGLTDTEKCQQTMLLHHRTTKSLNISPFYHQSLFVLQFVNGSLWYRAIVPFPLWNFSMIIVQVQRPEGCESSWV